MSGLSEVYAARGAVAISGATTVTGRAIFVGGAGTVVLTMLDGTTGTFAGCLAGVVYPFAFTAVTGASTATNMVALT